VESLAVLWEIFVLVFIQNSYKITHTGKGSGNSVKGKGLKEHRRIAGYFRHFKTVLLFCLSLIHGFTIQPVNSVALVCITSIANNCLIQIRITD